MGLGLLVHRYAAARARVSACLRALIVGCLHAPQAIRALSLGSDHDPGGYGHLLIALCVATCGHVSVRGPSEARLPCACDVMCHRRCVKTEMHVWYLFSGVRVSLTVILGVLNLSEG